MQQQLKMYRVATYVLVAIVLLVGSLGIFILQASRTQAATSQPQPSGTDFTWASVSAELSRSVSSPIISYDGQYLAYGSSMKLLVEGDTNNKNDVFVKDLSSGSVERVSVADNESQYSTDSYLQRVSSNGRYVLFGQRDSNNIYQVYMRDRQNDTTVHVSTSSSGSSANANTEAIGVSDDGEYILFNSFASNLDGPSTNNFYFLKNTQTGTVAHIPVPDPYGLNHTWVVEKAVMAADASKIVIMAWDNTVRVKDGQFNDIRRVIDINLGSSTATIISEPSTTAATVSATIEGVSRDGRYVLFSSQADFTGDVSYNSSLDYVSLFLRDTQTGGLSMIDKRSKGGGPGAVGPNLVANRSDNLISDDGRYIGFWSQVTTLDSGYNPTPTNNDPTLRQPSLYIRDRTNGTTTMMVNQIAWDAAFAPGAKKLAFTTNDNIYGADTGSRDIYLAEQ
jgi:hypothetical protein